MAEIMKDSGQEWIGAIPNTWTITKNKYVLNSVYSGGTPTATNSNYYCDDGYPFVNIADMSTVDYVGETNKYLTKDGLLDKNLRVLPSGTILYSMYATLGHVSELKIDAAISQAMLALFVDYKRMNKHFYKYNMMAASDYAISSAAGTTQMNLNAEKVINYVLVMPPINEQKAIADFLDDKCAEVDKLSEDIQKQIEILEEYKKSVITRAVTKGLDPNAEMKDSGIEWTKMIPSNWKRSKLLYCLRKPICDGPHETPDYVDDGVPFISVDSLNNTKEIDLSITKKFITEDDYNKYMRKAKLEKGDILFTKAATIGKTAIVGNEVFMVWSPIAIIKNNPNKIDNLFLYYLLNCNELIKSIELSGSYNTQANVGMREMERATIPLPDIETQKEIAIFLDRQCNKIDASIGIKNEQLNKLAEYKKSIIYEYVTGKKRVKGAK